uniref:small monomeric GTPase n=1 Tax=Macrostomum lignano TaxID=282301 RepID=A0A1I8GB34_9PLAT
REEILEVDFNPSFKSVLYLFPRGSPLEGDDIGTESQVKRNVNLRLRVCAAASAEKSVRSTNQPVTAPGPGFTDATDAVRYMTKKFIESYQSSCDVIYRHQIVVQENPIDVEILDTSSYERRGFSGLSACLDWADCFLVIYDVTMLDSAPRTRLFLELIRSVRGSERLPIVLIGNKTDMAHRGHVDKADMEILSS